MATTLKNERARRCKRADNFNPDTSHICSEHFAHTNYERDLQHELLGRTLVGKIKYTLPSPFFRFAFAKNPKKSAVPTLKLPGSKIIVKENSREERLEKRKRKVEVKNILTESSRHPQASTSRIRSDTPLSYDVSNEEKYKTLLDKYTILEKHFLQLKQTNRQKMKKTC